MAVSRVRTADESGQSILEVLFALPLIIGLFIIMVRTNTVVQMSIVNQKYARAQALFLARNSSVYPRRRLVEDRDTFQDTNRMITGVAENIYQESADFEPTPIAPHYRITRGPGKPGGGIDDVVDPNATELSNIQVLATVSLCTPSHNVRGLDNTMQKRIATLNSDSQSTPGLKSPVASITNPTLFAYCDSYMDRYSGP